jgi:hypothetical protein
MTEGTEQARTRITDPQVIRALAHPARTRIDRRAVPGAHPG